MTAVRAEAHALPFEEGSFDAIVSIDAFEYFGTADSYLPYLVRFLRPGGQLGIATPAMTREVRELGAIPPHIKALSAGRRIAWHTAEWWRFQWEITELVTSRRRGSRRTPGGTGCCGPRVREHQPEGRAAHQPVIDMLTADAGEFLSFALVTARTQVRSGGPDRKA